MTDEQLRRRLVIRRRLIVSFLLCLLSAALLYFRVATNHEIESYERDKAQESSVKSQIESMTAANNQLVATIEENGKQLVSFTEDKIKYINLASELSKEHKLVINDLRVSDIWQEGEMSCMTTTLEVEGVLPNVQDFLEAYCGSQYTNRIIQISCRPTDSFAWVRRGIDGNKTLSWFDITKDFNLYENIMEQQENSKYNEDTQVNKGPDFPVIPKYDPESGKFYNPITGLPATEEEMETTPITLDKLFAPKVYKVHIVVDFLGRS